MNTLRHQKCPLCFDANIYKIGDIAYHTPVMFSTHVIEISNTPEYWKCNKCGSSFVQNIIPEKKIIELYSFGSSSNRWSKIPFQEVKSKNILNALGKLFENNVKVLDIGCNTGLLLDFAKSKGCITTGVEYSEESRNQAIEKGHRCVSSIVEIDETFDVITAFDLVEHLYDCSGFFRFCRDHLKRNGKLAILTGNMNSISAIISRSNWWYIKYPEHIIFPSKKYYKNFSGFALNKWILTYAAVGYKNPISKIINKEIYNQIYNGQYIGLPSIGPDHVLVVLE
ncbi:MAG TPA: class I SAM-dependent methyltransferase [Spirochaetota bacterium]|nr:class I SAM-dependent methyltransferase [Spirochaetota bacterium]